MIAEVKCKLWRCATCDTVAPWGPGWRWFGSEKLLEIRGAGAGATLCSDECAAKFEGSARYKRVAAAVASVAKRRSPR
jgi:hypothetical protein